MDFMNDLDRALSKWGRDAVQKTKEVTDSAKISASLRSVEAQQRELFEQLGKLYYDAFVQNGGEASGAERDLISQIEDLDEQKKQLRANLNRIKGTIFCPGCNTEIPSTSRFCNVCGMEIKQTMTNTVSQTTGGVCSKCGAPVGENQAFCTSCGAPVSKQETMGGMLMEDEGVVRETKRVCLNCGTELKEGQKFCTGCGTPVA